MVGISLRVLLFVTLLSSYSLAQDSEVRDYQVAYGLYRDGQYQLALDEFSRFLQSYAGSARRADAAYLSGECLMNMGKTASAIQRFEAFTKEFPRSALVPDALFRIGEIMYRQEKYDSAVKRYSDV